jgi:hypothetical protein
VYFIVVWPFAQHRQVTQRHNQTTLADIDASPDATLGIDGLATIGGLHPGTKTAFTSLFDLTITMIFHNKLLACEPLRTKPHP